MSQARASTARRTGRPGSSMFAKRKELPWPCLCDGVTSLPVRAPAPTTTAAVACFGTASKTYVQPLMYHKEAFQFVTADLPLMDDAHKCVRRVQDGLSMRVWQASDIRNDELLMRIDILYGMAALRPEWACRMIGAAG